MLRYALLGQIVTFEDSAERYYDLQCALDQALEETSRRFKPWYNDQGSIKTVLDNYLPFTDSLIEELALLPLFNQLAACEIYDISEETYAEHCISMAQSESSLETIEQQYNAILKRQNAEKEYRADRKAGRSRWRGGGFGMSGAIKGAANAAVLNTASGLGHSVFNAIGNAGSAIAASMDKSALYKSSATQETLLHGILSDLCTIYSLHIDFLNECNGNYIQSVFNEDKSSALFENAKKFPEKQNELLIKAFELCPWDAELVEYLFIHFPNDRKTVYSAAQRFSIDLSDATEEILSHEYDDAARISESATLAAKARISALMKEYGVIESPTFDKLETDCLCRLCKGYESADEPTCNQMIKKVHKYDAQEKLKPPFIELLDHRIKAIWTEELEQICQGLDTTDEPSCENRLTEITAHKASGEFKSSYTQRVQDRIQAIWSEELAEICSGLDSADEPSCEKRMAAIKQHKAPDSMKSPYLQKIGQRIQDIWNNELAEICKNCEDADETACEAFLAAIKEHKAPNQLKAPFWEKVQSRIESIWAAEDGEIFDNLYMKTDITDPQAVAETVAYVQSKGRTASSQKYLEALNACTPKNIKSARLYQNTNRYRLYIVLAILSILASGFFTVTFLAAIPLFIMARNLKKTWKILTFSGAMVHPALLKPRKSKKKRKNDENNAS